MWKVLCCVDVKGWAPVLKAYWFQALISLSVSSPISGACFRPTAASTSRWLSSEPVNEAYTSCLMKRFSSFLNKTDTLQINNGIQWLVLWKIAWNDKKIWWCSTDTAFWPVLSLCKCSGQSTSNCSAWWATAGLSFELSLLLGVVRVRAKGFAEKTAICCWRVEWKRACLFPTLWSCVSRKAQHGLNWFWLNQLAFKMTGPFCRFQVPFCVCMSFHSRCAHEITTVQGTHLAFG